MHVTLYVTLKLGVRQLSLHTLDVSRALSALGSLLSSWWQAPKLQKLALANNYLLHPPTTLPPKGLPLKSLDLMDNPLTLTPVYR